MSYAIFGLIFVLLVVFCVMSRKQWHWTNIVFLILTYVAGVAAATGMSKALKLRNDDMAEAVRYEKLAEKNEVAANLAIYGPPDSITYDPKSLRGLNEQLSQEMLGRGRVWASGTVTVNEAKPANRDFQFAEARNPDNQQQNQMTGVLVYIFADDIVVDQTMYPVNFVATARIISEKPEQVELEPIFIADNELYANPAGTWSLFEKMPIDRRDAFKKHAEMMGDDFDLTAYRELLETQYLPAAKFGMDPNSEEYEELIDRYAFDGLRLGEITNWINAAPDRKNARFEPEPEEVFVEFRFDQKTDAVFDVDAGENSSIDSSGAFANGLAVDPTLKAGKKISFAKGETVIVDQLTAEGFQRLDGQNVPPFSQRYPVTEVDRYYIRQVRDYPYILTDLKRQSTRFTSELARVKKGVAETQAALDDALTQTNRRDDDIIKLQQDRQNMKSDLDAITRLFEDRTAQLDEIQNRVRQLEQQIEIQYRMLNGDATR